MGFAEELLETRVIHDRTLEMSLNYRLERPPKDNLDFPARSRAASTQVRKQRENMGEACDCRRCDCRQARIQQRPNPQTAPKSRDKSTEKPLEFPSLSHEIVTGFRSAEIGDKAMAAIQDHEAAARRADPIDYPIIAALFKTKGVKFASDHNRLSEAENGRLFETPHVMEMVALVRRGLGRLARTEA